MIIAYGMTSVAATIYFWKDDIAHNRYLYFIPTLIALPLLAYTFKAQILPLPPAPLRYWPYAIGAYLVIGAMILITQRGKITTRAIPAHDVLTAAT